MWQRKDGYDAVWRVCGVERVGIVEGIKGYGGSSVPIFPSIVITALTALQHAVSQRWPLDRCRYICTRRRVQLHRRTTSPSPTTREPAHHRLSHPASPAPASTHSPLLRSASCIQMLMLTARRAHSSLLSARVVAQDGSQPSLPLYDTVGAAFTTLTLNFALGSTGSENAAMAKFSVNLAVETTS